MDTRIAVITGTIFAGVLVAGALAAPRSDDAPVRETTAVTTTDGPAVTAPLEPSYDDHDDDDRHESDRNDDDDDHDEDDD